MTSPKKYLLYWAPRTLSILFILFLALFSFDVFDSKLGFWATLLALFIHNLPSLTLLVILIISWQKEFIAGLTFILAGFLYSFLISSRLVKTGFEWHYLAWIFSIAGPAFLTGILFLIGWRQRKNHPTPQKLN